MVGGDLEDSSVDNAKGLHVNSSVLEHRCSTSILSCLQTLPFQSLANICQLLPEAAARLWPQHDNVLVYKS